MPRKKWWLVWYLAARYPLSVGIMYFKRDQYYIRLSSEFLQTICLLVETSIVDVHQGVTFFANEAGSHKQTHIQAAFKTHKETTSNCSYAFDGANFGIDISFRSKFLEMSVYGPKNVSPSSPCKAVLAQGPSSSQSLVSASPAGRHQTTLLCD